MTTYEFAQRFSALLNDGKMDEIYGELYHPDILSVEADGAEYRGMDKIAEKNAWYDTTFEMHGMDIEGPFPHGDSFAMIYDVDSTHRASGVREKMREVAVYQVRDGRIAEERFFYVGMPE